MKSTVTLYFAADNFIRKVPVKIWKFPGGELGVRILEKKVPMWAEEFVIDLRARDNDGIMAAILLGDAVRQLGPNLPVKLLIPYLPYGRQNRVCNPGESASLDVVCKILTSSFDTVITVDPHVQVQSRGLKAWSSGMISDKVISWAGLAAAIPCFPDESARDRYLPFEPRNHLVAKKKRNLETGEIIERSLSSDVDVSGEHVLIMDDICDSGGTVIPVARELWQRGARKVSLYVTHGIFSKGTHLTGVGQIITTDSVFDQYENKNVKVFPLKRVML